MSIALYRKYRPGTFAEVRGQEHVAEPLQQALRNDRIHHAYLFSGPRGCGKTSAARILARSLNCEQGPTPDPCGACDPCMALAPTGPGSIDVIEIDAASHGGVDDARELRERAFYAPASSRFKVYVIDEAHMVTREGFNALLKLVEEPPPHLKFVFATTEPEKVIGTIRSRTHHYPFRLLAPNQLRDLVADICTQEGIEVEPAALPLVVRAGAGSARDALSILDQILAGAQGGRVTYAQTVGLLGYTDASLLDEMVEAFAAADGAAVFEAVNRVVEGGHDPRRFATDLLERFRDLLVLRSVPDAGTKGLLQAPPDQLERMVAQAGRMGAAELSRAADLFHEGLTEMRGATSPRLLLELMCARVLLPGAGTGESALLSRLERVERRMAIGGGPPSTETGVSSSTPDDVSPLPSEASQRPPQRHEEPGADADETSRRRDGASDLPPEPADDGAESAAAVRSEPATVTPATPGAAVEHEQDKSAPAGIAPAGELDVAAVRRVWPDVLEEVKNRRRVAWMILIGDVQVASVEGRSLTLAFAKDGDRKGFTTSGCDRVLQEALEHVLGVQWEIRAISGAARAERAHGNPEGSLGGSASHADADSGHDRIASDAGAPDAGAEPGSAGGLRLVRGGAESDPASGQAGSSAGAIAGQGGSTAGDAADADAVDAGAVDAGAVDAGAVDTDAVETEAVDAGAASTKAAGDSMDAGSFQEKPARDTSDTQAPASTDSPDLTLPAEADDEPGPSGIALVERELGGEIIEEVDES